MTRVSSDQIEKTVANRKPPTSIVALFLTRIFIAATLVTILGLLVFRSVWIAQVFEIGGLRFDRELIDDYPLVFFSVSTGDPSVYFYLVLTVLFVPLIFFRRSQIIRSDAWLVGVLQLLVWYSFIMIVVQWFVLLLKTLLLGRPAREFVTWTNFFWGASPDEGGKRLFGVPDPHYVTLLIGVLGLLMLTDVALVKRLWKFISARFCQPK